MHPRFTRLKPGDIPERQNIAVQPTPSFNRRMSRLDIAGTDRGPICKGDHMPDYSTLIDAQTWAFIEETGRNYPDNTAALAVDEQRRIYDAMCEVFHAGYPTGVTAKDDFVWATGRAIPVRRYAAPASGAAIVVYFHGGGFVVGGLESHDDICAEICGRTGYAVVSVDYRLCPEHPHPAQVEDAVDAFRHLAAGHGGPVVVCGDSAGGNLAAAVCRGTREDVTRPVGQVLIYPGLGGDRTKGSYLVHAAAPMLTVADVEYYDRVRSAGADVSRDPTFAPLADTDFSDLPPAVVVTAQCDPLCDDGRDYRDAMVAAGGRAVWFEEKGLVHGYLRGRHSVDRAGASFDRIVAAIAALGKSDWPY